MINMRAHVEIPCLAPKSPVMTHSMIHHKQVKEKVMKVTKVAAVIGMCAALTMGIAGPVLAAPGNSDSTVGIVVAQDTSSALTAKPSAPGAITVSASPKTRVSVFSKNRTKASAQPLSKVTDARGNATFSKLAPGATYTVMTSSASTSVTVVGEPGDAKNLEVTTTELPNALRLTWAHKDSAAQGKVRYRVEAFTTATDKANTNGKESSVDRITDVVTRPVALLTDLNPNVRYTFRVTPFNELGDGKSTTARMNRTLAEITGRSGDVVEVESDRTESANPTTPATPAISPAVTPSFNGGSSPAPEPTAPRTRTIYVCPDGYSDNGSTCQKTMGYTYSTRDYTYSYAKTGTETYTDTCASGYTDDQGQFHWIEQPHPCTRTRDVYGNIKDATPAGWSDTGSNWSKKDDAPAGWSDDGSQWVQTTDKVTQVVPA